MRVLFIQHYDDCPPGMVGDRLVKRGATIEVVDARSRFPDPAQFDLVVPLGSHDSALDTSLPYLAGEWALLERAIAADVPVFGICFGAQLLCRVLGGHVDRLPTPEIGWLDLQTMDPQLVPPGPWLVWHLDELRPGPGTTEVARTSRTTQCFVHGPHVGVQFHPEVNAPTVAAWAERYGPSFAPVDVDPAALVAETQRREDAARRQVTTLVDRVLTRPAGGASSRAAGGRSALTM